MDSLFKPRLLLAFWGAFFVALAVLAAFFKDILPPFIVGLFVAYLLNPVASQIENAAYPEPSQRDLSPHVSLSYLRWSCC